MSLGVPLVPLGVPHLDLFYACGLGRDTAPKALTTQMTEFDLSHVPPSLPQPPVPRPSPQGPPEARPYPILRRLSRPLWAALRFAPGRSRGGGATRPFEFPIRLVRPAAPRVPHPQSWKRAQRQDAFAAAHPQSIQRLPAAEHTAFAIAFETVSRSGSPNPAARAARHPAPGMTDASAVLRPGACRSHCQPPGRWKMPFEFPILPSYSQ
jgi:hypothetical protein